MSKECLHENRNFCYNEARGVSVFWCTDCKTYFRESKELNE